MPNDLGQYFTPFWAAEAIIERHFPDIDNEEFIIEPSCGLGSFLAAFPRGVEALGIEIDDKLAEIARIETGRSVITGDFRKVQIDGTPTLILGNPPFSTSIIDGFFDRSHELLPDGGRIGFILPAYALQTADRITRYAERWSIFSEMIPRNIFPGLSKPLVFSIFTKDKRRILVGMGLYFETSDKNGLPNPYRELMSGTTKQVWKSVCEVAIEKLGGEAHLQSIYAELERNRPTRTAFWREQIRKTLRAYKETFKSTGEGRYALN